MFLSRSFLCPPFRLHVGGVIEEVLLWVIIRSWGYHQDEMPSLKEHQCLPDWRREAHDKCRCWMWAFTYRYHYFSHYVINNFMWVIICIFTATAYIHVKNIIVFTIYIYWCKQHYYYCVILGTKAHKKEDIKELGDVQSG